MQHLQLIAALALGGCGTAPDSGDSADTAVVVDPDAPVVTSAQVTCYEHTTGDHYIQWTAAATVSDKQGSDTVETMARIEVSDARGDLGEEALVCAGGTCNGSWKDQDGPDLECDTIAVGTYDFAFIVTDIDGHESLPLVVHGVVDGAG